MDCKEKQRELELRLERLAFDAETRGMLGFQTGSDTMIGDCDSYGRTVGEFDAYVFRSETDCDDVETTRCCYAE